MRCLPFNLWKVAGAVLFSFSLSACDPSTNKADLERLLSPASLPYTKPAKMILVSSADSTGENNDRISIQPGAATTILNVTGPGVITRIWFALDSSDPDYLRKLVIRMYWDDEINPSVNVPLGDFFGCGFAYRPYISHYLGMTSGGFICYFPMPFEKSARIEIINESDIIVNAFYYQINYFKLEGYLDRSVAYFHALWNRSLRTDYDSNYTILKADGHGHVVGVNLQLQSYDGGFSFLEGNEVVYVDGENKPSIVGTGTEDYFSSGGFFNRGEFAGPFHGVILKDDSLGRISAYRLHITDPIPFKKHILFSIEHGHNNREIADYSSTVYWYQVEDHVELPALPISGQRLALKQVIPNEFIEAETLQITAGDIETVVEDVSSIGPDWSENQHLVFKSDSGDHITITLERMFDPSYSIDIYFSRGADYGEVELYCQNEKVGEIQGFSPVTEAAGNIALTGITPKYGTIQLGFRLTGKHPRSTGFFVGLDGLRITPDREFIPDWYTLGPFASTYSAADLHLGLDSVYPPEQVIDTNLRFAGATGNPIQWQFIHTPQTGYLSFEERQNLDETVITYALTYIYSLQERDLLLMIGTGNGTKVFFNNREVYRFTGKRMAEPDQVMIPVHVRVGWNKLLVKIVNKQGNYGIYARFMDPDNTLYYSAKQQKPPQEWLESNRP